MMAYFPHANSDVEWAVFPHFLTLICGTHYLQRARSGNGVHYFHPHPTGQNAVTQPQTNCRGAWERASSSVPRKKKGYDEHIVLSQSHPPRSKGAQVSSTMWRSPF